MTEHSPKFEKVKRYYDTGVWKIGRVREAVRKEWITIAEFMEITGEDY